MKEKVSKLLGRDKARGGEIIARILASEGVERAFGIIDGTYFGLYASFEPNGIDLVTPRHETSALHMAGSYARLTGRLGVAIASNGPGVANALPGVAVEQAEGNRVLLITSSRREGIVYPDRGGAFQCFPHVDVIGPMSKWSELVPSVDRLAELTRAALRESFTGRPGVVHLDVPESIMNGTYDVDGSWFRPPETYRVTQPIPPHPEQVTAAAKLLSSAERPMIHAGSGVLHAEAFDEMSTLAELLEAPVTTSWGARAAIDERSRYSVPMPFVATVNRARAESDAVLVLGSRLGETDWWGKAPYWATPDEQKMVQVDLDPSTIGNNRPADVAVQADVKTFLRALIDALRSEGVGSRETRRPWIDDLRSECASRREDLDEKLDDDRMPMHPAHVAATCRQVFDDDAILVADGGNSVIWAHFFHEVRAPNTLLATAKMGMLGAGCAQVLGAKVARPDKQVYCITGDGAMGFHPQEVETAVRKGLQVIWLVLCDKQWGMVKMNQQFALNPVKTLVKKSLSEEETIHADLGEIAFDDMARSMGAHGERVADPSGLANAIRRSLASGKPAVIHVDVDPVAHMWAPNLKDFKDMHAEPKGA
ncbi:MAG: thiamine pyrophosphate-binding protein [Myxococcota bacterium]